MEVIYTIEEPIPFAGDEIQRAANWASHHFASWDPEDCPRCISCDVKPWYVSADYFCGAEIPRRERSVCADGSEIITILGCEA